MDNGIVFISAMSQSLTCSVETGVGSFDVVIRNDNRLCALKVALYLKKDVGLCFFMISAAGTGPFVRLHGKINATVYKDILKKHVPNLRRILSMQDKAPCHTAKSVKIFLFVTVMKWPAQSLDMNPIENVWKLLNEKANEKNQRNVEELRINLKEKWEKMSVDECKTLIRSCSKRFQGVNESKGLYIKY